MSTLHERITKTLREGTVLHGTSLMSEEDRQESHARQMATKILRAICPDGIHPEQFMAWEKIPDGPGVWNAPGIGGSAKVPSHTHPAYDKAIEEAMRRVELNAARIGVIEDNLRVEMPPGFKKPWQDDLDGIKREVEGLRAIIANHVTSGMHYT